jgi:hypothetical protein
VFCVSVCWVVFGFWGWFWVWFVFDFCIFYASFLRGLFQFGDLHFGHCFGFSIRGVHLFPHRWHVSFGSSGMLSTGCRVHVIFGLSG